MSNTPTLDKVLAAVEANKPVTAGEIYLAVAEHLQEQGGWAMTKNHGVCQYRTEDGMKCAIGGLIPDIRYDPAFDARMSVSDVLSTFPTLKEHERLLVRLQTAHDGSSDMDDGGEALKQSLIEIGTDWSLAETKKVTDMKFGTKAIRETA